MYAGRMDRFDDDEVQDEERRSVDADALTARRRRRAYQTRVLAFGVVVAAVWMGLALDPRVGQAIWGMVLAIALTLGVLGVAVGLGWVGGRLFNACGRVWRRIVTAATWPDDEADRRDS